MFVRLRWFWKMARLRFVLALIALIELPFVWLLSEIVVGHCWLLVEDFICGSWCLWLVKSCNGSCQGVGIGCKMMKIHCPIQRHSCLIRWQKDWLFLTVIRPKDFHFLSLNSNYILLSHICRHKTLLMASLPWNKCFIISLLEVTPESHLVFVCDTSFNFKQKLFIPLDSHHDLAMNILDVHIFPPVTCMSAHQRCLVSCIRINIVHCGCSCCVLQWGCDCVVIVLRCLLYWVDRTVILVHWCGLREVLGLLHSKHLLSIIKALYFIICNFSCGLRNRFVRVLVLRVCSWVSTCLNQVGLGNLMVFGGAQASITCIFEAFANDIVLVWIAIKAFDLGKCLFRF